VGSDLPKLKAQPQGEATDLIAFAAACFYFSRFWPKNLMSSPKTI
jgi:hypothetical protein